MTDAKTLVIGQDVYLNAGAYGLDGKVVKIRWSHAVWRLFGLKRRVCVQPYRGLHDRIPPGSQITFAHAYSDSTTRARSVEGTRCLRVVLGA
jgi:hypothetical protein